MSSDLVELTVERLASGGDGIGRLESGRIVFVPRTAPGDRVLARLTENRKRWSRARVVKLRAGGACRVAPVCPHYTECGGCHLQHLDAATQMGALQTGVEDALTRIGGLPVRVRTIESGEKRFGYRNRVSFTLRRSRGNVTAGYHGQSGRALVEIDTCPLAEPAVQDAWQELRAGWGKAARHLPGGGELRLTIRASASGRTALWAEGGSSPGDPDRILESVSTLESYWWKPSQAPRRHLGGNATLVDEWDGLPIVLRPRAFLQVNREVAERLEAHLDEHLGRVAGLRILDLYAGIGLRAVRWVRAGAEVVSVECEADAVETGRDLARASGAEVDVRMGGVEEVLETLLPADVLFVNPPRGGLDPRVTEVLVRAEADRLVYISCDPATLARDLKRLAGSWSPDFAQPFDAFPQTRHVETVLWLKRRRT